MYEKIFTISAVLFQIVILSIHLFISGKTLRRYRKTITPVFLSFTFVLWLFTDLYWLTFDLMRPETRMPFAANEIGEAAFFLTLAATIGTGVSYDVRIAKKQAVGAVLFAACNTALWIGWSGEMLQDVFIGLVYGLLLYTVVCSLRTEQLVTAIEWVLLALLCTALIATEAATFFVASNLKIMFDTAGYLLLVLGIVFWIVKLYLVWKNEPLANSHICTVCSLLTWAITAKYMSEGNWYLFFMSIETLCIPLLYLSVRKAVENI
ncbi:MAG: hypothetical protein K6G65_03435 [Lachnospiraceae bacterium]|nr:hypothetical protein [Lachnospiraceae bacterium]